MASTALSLPPSAAKHMTATEFYDWVHRPENRGRFFELERGEVVEMPPAGKFHGFVCGNTVGILRNFAIRRKRGYVCSNDTGVVVEKDPDSVRGPDVTFYDDLQKAADMERQYSVQPPLLAVEIQSPNDRFNRTIRRITELLRSGVAMVWLIDPEGRDVSVYRPGRDPVVFTEDQELTCEDVLADFRCKVAEFFAVPGA